MLDLGGVVGYIYEIQHITRCKVGRKIVGMNFQTRSKATILYFSKIWQIGALGRHIHFSVAVCGNSIDLQNLAQIAIPNCPCRKTSFVLSILALKHIP